MFNYLKNMITSINSAETSPGLDQDESFEEPVKKIHEPLITLDELLMELDIEYFNEHSEIKEILSILIREYYEKHRIEEAFETLQKLEDQLKDKNLTLEIVLSKLSLALSNFIKSIQNEHKLVEEFLRNLSDNQGWEIESSSEECTVRFKCESDKTVLFKIEGELDCSTIGLAAILMELDLYGGWVPFLKTVQTLKRIHKASSVAYCSLAIPPPLKSREYHMVANAYDRTHKNGSLLVLSRSVDEDLEFLKNNDIQLQYATSSPVLNKVRIAAFELTPVSQEKTSIRCLISMDPHMRFIPSGISNYFCKLGSGQTFTKLKKAAEDYKNSVYEARVNAKGYSEMYDWVRTALSDLEDRKLSEQETEVVPIESKEVALEELANNAEGSQL